MILSPDVDSMDGGEGNIRENQSNLIQRTIHGAMDGEHRIQGIQHGKIGEKIGVQLKHRGTSRKRSDEFESSVNKGTFSVLPPGIVHQIAGKAGAMPQGFVFVHGGERATSIRWFTRLTMDKIIGHMMFGGHGNGNPHESSDKKDRESHQKAKRKNAHLSF